MPAPQASDAAVAAVFREEAGRLTATLVRMLGDFESAEELVQEALLVALERWRRDGIPSQPRAWLATTARRLAIDQWRRRARYADKLAEVAAQPLVEATSEADDRLRLIFTCCHPALAREAQLALTLRAVAGLTTAEIARAFLVPEATVAQRIVRAKRKIVTAGIPYRVPSGPELVARLDEVLAVLYLMFNEGYLATEGAGERHDLAADAEWLTALVVELLPDEPEALGLLALMRLHQARSGGRFGTDRELIVLAEQDRSRWDRDGVAAGAALVVEALQKGRPGPYQVQAAIAACHAEAPSWEETDWDQIALLYEKLVQLAPSPVLKLNRAIALSHVLGPEAALEEIDALAPSLDHYHLFHATRAEMLRQLRRMPEARLADERALQLTRNPAERTLLSARLFQTAPLDYEATPLTSRPGAAQSSLRASQRRRRT
ncbi:MAG: sigma-70 family RNA polymerase sigma factor [Candidatus Dormibacteraeota bacterium]|nr:sigma-70 family RNA polymerase sigma factor [Candidatus Dormibacteraeota bacterium]